MDKEKLRSVRLGLFLAERNGAELRSRAGLSRAGPRAKVRRGSLRRGEAAGGDKGRAALGAVALGVRILATRERLWEGESLRAVGRGSCMIGRGGGTAFC